MDVWRTGICIFLTATGLGCSSESTPLASTPADAGAETPLASDANPVDSSNDAPLECDPPPWANEDAADLDVGTNHVEGGVIIFVDGGDLEGGEKLPIGRTVCGIAFEPDAEPQDRCPNFGLVCCLLKQVCYDPPVEPDFCLRPYCAE